MNDAELKDLIDACVAGDITPKQHKQLQEELKSNPRARAVFREVLDVEASLRSWAAESSGVGFQPAYKNGFASWKLTPLLAIAASIALVALSWWFWRSQSDPSEQIAEKPSKVDVNRIVYVGTLGQQQDCLWSSTSSAVTGSRFSTRKFSLTSGVAELKLDSGTNVLLQGPCDLEIVDADAASLLAGNVVVNVTELSDGFTLNTPDATIIDEGTEYAVSLDDDATEVHVFDGSVIWEPVTGGGETVSSERIESGEARRYLRSQPLGGARIPLGMRLFVRQLDASVRENAGETLLAYDGFENLAGRIRQGRSGFGWSAGWQSGRRARGRIAQVIDAPDSIVFGIDRTGRRLIRLSDGDIIAREFEKPLRLKAGNVYYASFLLKRAEQDDSVASGSGQFFQLSLVNDGERRGHRSRIGFTFGITSEGLPFIKSVGSITSTAPTIEVDSTHFCVAKILVTETRHVESFLRIYRAGESIDSLEPTAWTVVGHTGPCNSNFSGVRLSVGAEANYDVDELKIGTTWQSVTALSAVSP